MDEFAALVEEHKETYKIIDELKTTLNSTDKFKIMDEIKNFRNQLRDMIEQHFEAEERIIFPKLDGKNEDITHLIGCIVNEHKEFAEKQKLLDELLEKYEAKPTNINYEAILETVKELADKLYNHSYSEDVTIFVFAGTVLNDEEKQTIARELAQIACICCPSHKEEG